MYRRFWTLLRIYGRFSTLLGASVLNHIEFVANTTLLGASVPNLIEFVANSTLLGASVRNRIEFVANSTLLGRNSVQSTIEQFDAFERKFSSKRRITFGTFRRMASKSFEFATNSIRFGTDSRTDSAQIRTL